MRIAQVAPLWERIPPRFYGGTERVVYDLTEQLVKMGHEVTLFASGDSITSARLIAPLEQPIRLSPQVVDPFASHVLLHGMVYDMAQEFDIIHCHTDYLSFPLARLTGVTTLVTLHGRLDLRDIKPIFAYYEEANLVSVSNSQRIPLPDGNWIATVYHGVRTGDYPLGRGRGGYLAFLGRITPEKRPDLAIEIAKRVGLKLIIAAKVDNVDLNYFEEVIEPLLDNPLVEFIGEIDEEAKKEFLGDAVALLFPIDWPEPFGLVMIEAMACGTPVITRPCGSAPEVVVNGITGFIKTSVEELAQAVRLIDKIDRAACRKHVEQNFSAQKMTDNYEIVYYTLLGFPYNTPQNLDRAGQNEVVEPRGGGPHVEEI